MSALCPVAYSCGACPLIALDAQDGRTRKLTHVQELLARAGFDRQASFHPAPTALSYRSRVRLRVDENGGLGFFNHQKSEQCAVLREDLLRILASLRALSHTHPSLFSPFKSAELRAPDLDGLSGLLLTPRDPLFSYSEVVEWRETASQLLPKDLITDFRPQDPTRDLSIDGVTPPITQRLAITQDVFTRVPLFGFVQIHRGINEVLVSRVLERARQLGTRQVLDLYCGSGNFALPLSAAGFDVHGIEVVAASIAGAREAARAQDLGARFHHGSAQNCSPLARRLAPDLLVCDPPRAGLGASLEWIAALNPPHIILCACNPKSLVRDLRELVGRGYHLETVELFDMFAHTEHVEILATLTQRTLSLSRS